MGHISNFAYAIIQIRRNKGKMGLWFCIFLREGFVRSSLLSVWNMQDCKKQNATFKKHLCFMKGFLPKWFSIST